MVQIPDNEAPKSSAISQSSSTNWSPALEVQFFSIQHTPIFELHCEHDIRRTDGSMGPHFEAISKRKMNTTGFGGHPIFRQARSGKILKWPLQTTIICSCSSRLGSEEMFTLPRNATDPSRRVRLIHSIMKVHCRSRWFPSITCVPPFDATWNFRMGASPDWGQTGQRSPWPPGWPTSAKRYQDIATSSANCHSYNEAFSVKFMKRHGNSLEWCTMGLSLEDAKR